MASFTLFERVGNASVVRVQADNIDRPFDINSGARLNLGSTAKLRTLGDIPGDHPAELHARYAGMSKEELARVKLARQDALSHWTIDYLSTGAHTAGPRWRLMLDAAMERKYSGSPGEGFYYRRRAAELHQLRALGRRAHHDRARGLPALGQPGVHPHDARHRAL
ncbi:hypothetical protein ACTMU2_26970 [Cupriavidus basilensis]